MSATQVPDLGLDWTDDQRKIVTASLFLETWINNEDQYGYIHININTLDAGTHSFLCGVQTPINAPSTQYGETFGRGSVNLGTRPALSFIFTARIPSYVSEDQKKFLIRYAVMHEIGHARGLNNPGEDGNHSPSGDDCAMKALDPTYTGTPAGTFIIPYCNRHKRILSNDSSNPGCLGPSIQNNYDPNASCAQLN